MKTQTLWDEQTKTRYYLVTTDLTPKVYAPYGANSGNRNLADIVKEKSFPLAINAGLFYPKTGEPITYKPEGIIIENGVVIQNATPILYSDSMPLTIDRNGDLWYTEATADAYDLVNRGIVHAVCGFMPIIVDGEAVPQERWTNVPHYTIPERRQIIGQYRNGAYAVITCHRTELGSGWTISRAQEVCKKHGLWFAYNLDGGSSNETVVDGVQINSFCQRDEGRFAPTFIIFERN